MKYLYIVIFVLITTIDVHAAGAGIPGTIVGFDQQKENLTKSFNITYPAVAGAAAAAVLSRGAGTAIDNWHKTERQFLKTLKENLSHIPEPGNRPAGAAARAEWRTRKQLWERIESAVYARASMTVIYDQARSGGGFSRHTKTYTFPYVFSSGDLHRDRVIALDQQSYPFCSYNTMNPNGGNPICQKFIGLIDMPDADFRAASTASKAAFINGFQDLYNPDVHDVLVPLPAVGPYNILPAYFPYPPVGAAVAEEAKNAFNVLLAHAEMVAYTHFTNRYQNIIADLNIPVGRIRAIVFNVAVTRDTCGRCHRTLYLRSFQNLALPAPAAGGVAPAPVPLLINVSAIRDYEDSRPALDIQRKLNNRVPPAGGAGHPLGGILYLYR